MDYSVRATVIVPVYNVKDYLKTCIESLVSQSIPKTDMEVLLIDDGSTDNSLEICREYEKQYSFIRVFTKENEGLSATRNYGIKRARGKYLFFLDSDDYLTIPTVEKVVDFFDTIYDEVDLVAYHEAHFIDNRIVSTHYRFHNSLKEEGVYDLEEYPYITQTRINVCVKNLGPDNHLFHHDRNFRQEDQEYNNRVLMRKMKIGYCPDGRYMYNRGNESSIVHMFFHAYYMFEYSMKYFEELFGYFEGDVPKYFQAMYLNDLNYKLKCNILYPYHYNKERFEEAKQRIVRLLNRVDVEVIANHPAISNFHRNYWISMKENAFPTVLLTEDSSAIFCNGNMVYRRKEGIEIMVVSIESEGDILRFRGRIKSPIFNYIDAPSLYVTENLIDCFQDTAEGEQLMLEYEYKYEVPLFLSSFSADASRTKTNNFYAFDYRCDTTRVKDFGFVIRAMSVDVRATFVINRTTGISVAYSQMETMRGDILVKFMQNQNRFFVQRMSRIRALEKKKEISEEYKTVDIRDGYFGKLEKTFGIGKIEKTTFEKLKEYILDFSEEVYTLRNEALALQESKRIWLYYDLYTVEKDNGYYQFVNDFKHDDNVERYYVYNRPIEEISHLFSDEQRKNMVEFGSEQHKLLYLASELILTAYYGYSPISPFQDEGVEFNFFDIKRFKVIYLQHGVLHASLRKQNSVENYRADRIVISSFFEKWNYMENYHYNEEDLICTGMARFDHINRNAKAKKKILFAPSWREYFTNVVTPSRWEVLADKIKSSDYYKKINAFLHSDYLMGLLEDNDIILEMKLHPILSGYDDLFEVTTDCIRMADTNVHVEEYCMFITDYSSYVFDYAYLNRPIMYFVPDYDQFKSGMGHYRELDLPFEKAFGHLVLDAEDAVQEVARIIHRNFTVEPVFSERMQHFYFDFSGGCAESTYQYCMRYMEEND